MRLEQARHPPRFAFVLLLRKHHDTSRTQPARNRFIQIYDVAGFAA